MLSPVIANVADRSATPQLRQNWHLVTSEYPPQTGGVADYTHLMAAEFAAHGDDVHVWCPSNSATPPAVEGVTVHQDLGNIAPADLRRVDRALEQFAAPRRLLVQWVPHGYRFRSMNVAFCWWLHERARRHGDQVELIVHEPYLSFRAGALRQSAAALVHRVMAMLILRAAQRVWVTIPEWERCLKPYALGRSVPFQWLPIFSNVPVQDDPERVARIRREYAGEDRILIGHFGTFGGGTAGLLETILRSVATDSNLSVLLMGLGSEQYRENLIRKEPQLAGALHATGTLPADELSCHLSACDLLVQPYVDGVSCRRGSFMAGISHGKAIVTTVGELSEPFWSQSDAAAIVPVADIEGFTACIRRLSADAAARERLGNAARALYLERFDISRVVASLYQAGAAPERVCGS